MEGWWGEDSTIWVDNIRDDDYARGQGILPYHQDDREKQPTNQVPEEGHQPSLNEIDHADPLLKQRNYRILPTGKSKKAQTPFSQAYHAITS